VYKHLEKHQTGNEKNASVYLLRAVKQICSVLEFYLIICNDISISNYRIQWQKDSSKIRSPVVGKWWAIPIRIKGVKCTLFFVLLWKRQTLFFNIIVKKICGATEYLSQNHLWNYIFIFGSTSNLLSLWLIALSW
jgi:hypothetical protein